MLNNNKENINAANWMHYMMNSLPMQGVKNSIDGL